MLSLLDSSGITSTQADGVIIVDTNVKLIALGGIDA